MKIMDYEKKYKDALSHAKQAYGTGAYDDSTLEAIFPELAENEDERIRKELISQVEKSRHHPADKARWISWIEKQKEQKPELPLMGGDTDTYFDDLRMTTKPLTSREWFNEGIKYAQRLQKEQKPSSKFNPADWVVYDGPLGHAILQIKDVIDGRYSFVDNESTLLVEDSDKFLRPLTPKDVEKPAEWSEKDKAFLKVAIATCNRYSHKDIADWLKSLPERLNFQPKEEWSDEDEETIGTLINYFEGDALDYSTDEMIRRIRALRPSWKPSKEQMEVLLSTQDMVRSSGYRQNAKVLASLYEQLKRLL